MVAITRLHFRTAAHGCYIEFRRLRLNKPFVGRQYKCSNGKDTCGQYESNEVETFC